jgi:AraC family transcriptional regulator
MTLLSEKPYWLSAPLGQDRLRLEVYHTHKVDLGARELSEHFLTLQAIGLARVEIYNGRAARSYLIPTGAFCFSPYGPAARVRWSSPRTLFVVALSPRWIAAIAQEHGHGAEVLRPAIAARDPHVEWIVRALVLESRDGMPTGSLYLDTLANALVVRLLSHQRTEQTASRQRGGLGGIRLRAILERIHTDPGNPPPLIELAKLAGLSIDHFVRAFRSSIGEPPHRYMLRERIRVAQQLLASTSKPLAEIALQTGFADQSHFTIAFRRWVGTTPARYRFGA